MRKFSFEFLCREAFAWAKRDLDIQEMYLSVENFNDDTYAYLESNTIFVNKKMFKASKIYEIVDTIFHEAKHRHQHLNSTKKSLNESIESILPIPFSNNSIFLIDEEQIGLNPFFLYFTADNEKDARDYAEIMTKKYLQHLNQTCVTNKGKKFFKKQLDLYNVKCEKNLSLYETRIGHLKAFNLYYIKNIKTKIGELLEKFSNNYDQYKDACHIELSSYLLVCCDNEIANNIYNFAIEHNSIKTLLTLINCPYVKVSQPVLNQCFAMAKHESMYIDDIQDYLSNWDNEFVKTEYEKFIKTHKKEYKIQKNEQKSTKTA